MGCIITIYVERFDGQNWRPVARTPWPERERSYSACDPDDPRSKFSDEYEWYSAHCGCNRAVANALTFGDSEIESMGKLESPEDLSPELEAYFEHEPGDGDAEFPLSVCLLSELLAFDFDQITTMWRNPEPLRESCGDLIAMSQRVQAAVGDTPPDQVRLLTCVLW